MSAASGRVAAAPAVDPVVLALYGLLAVAATGRSTVQLAGHAADAPLAYGLSAVAAIFYVLAGFALRRTATSAFALTAARLICATELAGVLAVGLLTVVEPGMFPDDTVWSAFGAGYGFAPLVLPAIALVALAKADGPRSGARGR